MDKLENNDQVAEQDYLTREFDKLSTKERAVVLAERWQLFGQQTRKQSPWKQES